MIKSPCVKECEMNPNTNLCKGCFRNIEEIGNWSNFTNNQKIHILKLVKKRRDA